MCRAQRYRHRHLHARHRRGRIAIEAAIISNHAAASWSARWAPPRVTPDELMKSFDRRKADFQINHKFQW